MKSRRKETISGHFLRQLHGPAGFTCLRKPSSIGHAQPFLYCFSRNKKELCGNLRKLSWCPIEAESGGNGQRQALDGLDHRLSDGGMQD